jgi:hypothetical protein
VSFCHASSLPRLSISSSSLLCNVVNICFSTDSLMQLTYFLLLKSIVPISISRFSGEFVSFRCCCRIWPMKTIYVRISLLIASNWWYSLPVYCRLYCQILYSASSAMKIPKAMLLMVAASYSFPAVGSVSVRGNGWKFKPPLSLLYLTIFASSVIFVGGS